MYLDKGTYNNSVFVITVCVMIINIIPIYNTMHKY